MKSGIHALAFQKTQTGNHLQAMTRREQDCHDSAGLPRFISPFLKQIRHLVEADYLINPVRSLLRR
jgi:hypothetical protein